MKYEPALDGLRGAAIIAVVGFHAYGTIVPGGWAGVDVFFVLSGYLITRLLDHEHSTRGRISFLSFYIRRALRLMPALLLLLIFELLRAAFDVEHRTEIIQASAVTLTYLMNWNRVFGWFPQDVLGHTWSLAIEEQFYILWPLCFLALSRARRDARFVYCAAAIFFLWRCALVYRGGTEERIYNGFDTHADPLLMGCAVALTPITQRIKTLLARAAAIPIAVLVAIVAFVPYGSSLALGAGPAAVAISSAWMLVVLLQPGVLNRIFSAPAIVYTGRISYGWYLWHYPILLLAYPYMPRHIGAFILVAISYAVAAVSFNFLERPILKLKKRWEPAGKAFRMATS